MLQGKERGLGGNMKGDAYQNGGLIIVKEGKIIYSFIQENPADHASNADILKVQQLILQSNNKRSISSKSSYWP